MIRRLVSLVLVVLVTLGVIYVLANPTRFVYSIRGLPGFVPPMGTLLDPAEGLWHTARASRYHDGKSELAGLKADARIIRDDRGVPHIYAEEDRDAIMAMGYALAEDRLFQLDFIPRAAAGRLSEVFGAELLPTDRYLRSTGMEWTAERDLARLKSENGISYDLLTWFADGVNAYVDQLDDEDLPLEFRLLDYRPDRYSPIQGLRVLMYMSYDLSFHTDDISYGRVQKMMDPAEYEKLFPTYSRLFEPIVPGSARADAGKKRYQETAAAYGREIEPNSLFPGFEPGKGSNNWAVTGNRSATGKAILAGDMHLRLTLPSIWYEVHLSTKDLDTYGVTIPGAPLPVEAFNNRFGWTFTNSGADQIDQYRLELNENKSSYRFEDEWVPFDIVLDTVFVRGAGTFVDTLRYTRFGPVMGWDAEPYAVQWTAHKSSRTLEALWDMHHAVDSRSFQKAISKWDAPMQNILYADSTGTISIRTAGYLPIRRSGTGAGLLDGTSNKDDWTGRVPFDQLPFAENPAQGYLASANQQPTARGYKYYVNHDWATGYRSLRINELLRSRDKQTVADLKAYQSDVHVVQYDLFVPLLDTLSRLSPDAAHLRDLLKHWNGNADIDRPEPLVLDHFLKILERLTWDEFDAESARRPREQQLYYLLTEEPKSQWLDIRDTQLLVERSADLLRSALETTVDTLRARYGWGEENWTWGDHHVISIQHLTRSKALSALGYRKVPYPGFDKTLSPARRRETYHSASWRMVVDFSTSPPEAFGVFPGGESGNPYSAHYDDFIPTYLQFGYYRLSRPERPEDALGRQALAETILMPAEPTNADTLSTSNANR